MVKPLLTVIQGVTDAKLYTDKTAITSADMLNDRMLPWYEEQGIPILRILTDRGA